MTASNHPENQNPKGLPDLVQINKFTAIPERRWKAMELKMHGTKIRASYYGGKAGDVPDSEVQISIGSTPWNLCLYMTPGELRRLAATLIEAACTIEDGQRSFDAQKHGMEF